MYWGQFTALCIELKEGTWAAHFNIFLLSLGHLLLSYTNAFFKIKEQALKKQTNQTFINHRQQFFLGS